MAHAQFTDYESNVYETYEYKCKKIEHDKPIIESNTNIRLKFVNADVALETKRIASLMVKACSSTWRNKDMSFNFRDLPIECK